MDKDKKDFFISYTKSDREWAVWIAWQLEEAGYKTVIQEWDFKPGTNFVLEMNKALIDCSRFIAVISPDYFESSNCNAEWSAAFEKDPSCEKGLFIPVRVKDFSTQGLLKSVVYIDLVGVEGEEKREKLLSGVRTDRKPTNRPAEPGTSSKTRSPGQLPFNNLPYIKNPHFTGRKDTIDYIRKSFESGELTQVVSGLGGFGKTQIVLEYAYRYAHLYETIWWVHAESSEKIMQAYTDLAHKKSFLDKTIVEKDLILEAVWNWMSQHKDWLFIYDNAEDLENLKGYLPRNNTGHILITSIHTGWKSYSDEIEIDVFVPNKAKDFLIQRTGIEDESNASQLAEVLGYLPLALEQAGAYIVRNKIDFKKYLCLYKKHKLELFKDQSFKPNDYDMTVTVTWNVTLTKIRMKSAKQLLYICSYFAPDNIKKDILAKSKKYLSKPLANIIGDELKVNMVINELSQYSLIKRKENRFSMHRLLQEVIRESISLKPKSLYMLLRYLCFFQDNFTFDKNNVHSWHGFSDLVPHALSVATHITNICKTINFSLYKHFKGYKAAFREIAGIYNESGRWFNHIAIYSQAETLYKEALNIHENILGEKYHEVINIYCNIAEIYFNKGCYLIALVWYGKALKASIKILGTEHLNTAAIYIKIVDIFIKSHNYEEALECYKKALVINKKILGKEHPYTMEIYNSMATLHKRRGHDKAALEWHNKTLEIFEEMENKDDIEAGASLLSVGDGYAGQGDYRKALECYKRTLKIYQEAQGKKEWGISKIYVKIAFLYDIQGDYLRALQWYKDTLETYNRTLGKEHPTTLKVHNKIAGLYKLQKDYEEALKMYQIELITCEKVFGKEHPSTLQIYSDIAGVYKDLKNYDKALEWYQKAVVILKKVLGEDHHVIIKTFNNIANVYKSLGDKTKAHEWTQKESTIKGKAMGKEYLYIAQVYDSEGNYEMALEHYKNASHSLEKAMGKVHPDTVAVYNEIARVYENRGEYEKALEWSRKEEINRNMTLGEEYKQKAEEYKNKQDYEKALEWYKKALVIFEKTLGKESFRAACICDYISKVYEIQGDNEKALEWYQKAAPAREWIKGLEYSYKASIYKAEGDYKMALEDYKKAIPIYEQMKGKEHPKTIKIYNGIAECQKALNNK